MDPQARRMGAGRDLHALRKDGSEIPVEIGLNPVETAEGRYVLSAIVDITERKGMEEKSRKSMQLLPEQLSRMELLDKLTRAIGERLDSVSIFQVMVQYLEKAYEDLRQSQATVMQQERLRALGQMASGIAHGINNAISPISLYVDLLREEEPGLSADGRKNVEIIGHAIEDVEATVGRMREFYRQHGAEVEIESQPGSGSTFRLLVVDDDPPLLEPMQRAMRTLGHEAIPANGGQAGIDVFRALLADGQRIDAVVSDLGMPYVDGRKVAAAVKQASPETPVILLTGWGQKLNTEEEQIPNVDRILSKPPKLSTLRETFGSLAIKP